MVVEPAAEVGAGARARVGAGAGAETADRGARAAGSAAAGAGAAVRDRKRPASAARGVEGGETGVAEGGRVGVVGGGEEVGALAGTGAAWVALGTTGGVGAGARTAAGVLSGGGGLTEGVRLAAIAAVAAVAVEAGAYGGRGGAVVRLICETVFYPKQGGALTTKTVALERSRRDLLGGVLSCVFIRYVVCVFFCAGLLLCGGGARSFVGWVGVWVAPFVALWNVGNAAVIHYVQDCGTIISLVKRANQYQDRFKSRPFCKPWGRFRTHSWGGGGDKSKTYVRPVVRKVVTF